MAFYADIGKGCKDLLGGYNFDNKVSVASQVHGMNINTNTTKKGESFVGDVKTSYTVCKGFVTDATITNSGKVSTNLIFTDLLAGGLKTTVSSDLPDISTAKLSFLYAKNSVGLKADMGLNAAPKIDVATAFKSGPVILGTEVGFDSAKGNLTKYNFAGAYKHEDITVSAAVADKFDTIKFNYLHALNSKSSMGLELSHKMSTGVNGFVFGANQKLENGASAKGMIDNKGILSLLYTSPLAQPKASVSFSASVDTKQMDKSAKVGVQLNIKA